MSCWFNFAGSPFLTPEAVYCCPGERVTFTCVVNTGNKLYWDVDYSDPSLPDIHGQRYLATEDQPGRRKYGNSFEFNLTSNSPTLISTAFTTVQQQLDGTRVHCTDAASLQKTSMIHIVQGMINRATSLRWGDEFNLDYLQAQFQSAVYRLLMLYPPGMVWLFM